MGEEEIEKKLRHIAHLIGSIFFYGNFKAETANEKILQILLEDMGYFYKTEDELMEGKKKIIALLS